MQRLLFLAFVFFAALPPRSAAAQAGDATGLPPRPAPFRFVNDQAQLLAPADAKKLEGGLRRYADNTGTQVVVVTVPSLGGRTVADYGRALGTAWGVGQRDKNNGLVVLLSAREHQVTIQPGSGLKSTITPAIISLAIGDMTPGFKQGNYFGGLRKGLNTLMLAANPSSNPKKNESAAGSVGAGSAASAGAAGVPPANPTEQAPAITTNDPIMAPPAPAPVSSGPGIGTLLIGALVIGGGLWFLLRLFRRRSAAGVAIPNNPNTPTNSTPNFLPNRPTGPAGPGPGQAPGNYGSGGYGNAPNQGGGGMGMGGMLATGAVAAAGAYLGNRMASGHETSGQNSGQNLANDGTNAGLGGVAGAGAGTAAAGDYFSSREGGTAGADNAAPDYFSDDNTAADNSSSDYFSSDDNNASYDDTSSNDTGGGGFDGDSSGSDNSGSW